MDSAFSTEFPKHLYTQSVASASEYISKAYNNLGDNRSPWDRSITLPPEITQRLKIMLSASAEEHTAAHVINVWNSFAKAAQALLAEHHLLLALPSPPPPLSRSGSSIMPVGEGLRLLKPFPSTSPSTIVSSATPENTHEKNVPLRGAIPRGQRTRAIATPIPEIAAFASALQSFCKHHSISHSDMVCPELMTENAVSGAVSGMHHCTGTQRLHHFFAVMKADPDAFFKRIADRKNMPLCAFDDRIRTELVQTLHAIPDEFFALSERGRG